MSSSSSLTVAVLSPCDNPALAGMPKGMPGVEFIVANDLETFQASPNLADVEALMFCPPADPALLDELWPHVPRVKWCHGFFAGVDSLANFMPRLAEKGVPLSNGRGAFSQSLAECTPPFPHPHTPLLRVRHRRWQPHHPHRPAFARAADVMAAAFHFNKQIPRCQRNRVERKWDKFVMDTVEGKTMGFLGL